MMSKFLKNVIEHRVLKFSLAENSNVDECQNSQQRWWQAAVVVGCGGVARCVAQLQLSHPARFNRCGNPGEHDRCSCRLTFFVNYVNTMYNDDVLIFQSFGRKLISGLQKRCNYQMQ